LAENIRPKMPGIIWPDIIAQSNILQSTIPDLKSPAFYALFNKPGRKCPILNARPTMHFLKCPHQIYGIPC